MFTRTLVIILLGGLCVMPFSSAVAQDKDSLRVLFLTKSSGFVHSAVQREGDNLSVAETALSQLAAQHGVTIDCTKDASVINPEGLKKYDLVIFYTSGDLTQPGTDGNPPMPADGVAALRAWVEAGGAFMGFHSATDTLHGAESPYIKLIGAEFRGHGRQFKGTINVLDPTHPAMVSIPKNWSFLEEWYLFKNFNEDSMHVLATLEPGKAERKAQPGYDLDAIPIIWCSTLGKGRVFYNAMGHNHTVWQDPTFLKHVADAACWTLGHGPAQAEPDVGTMVDAEKLAEAIKAYDEAVQKQLMDFVNENVTKAEGWWMPKAPVAPGKDDQTAWGNRGRLYGPRDWVNVPPQLNPYLKHKRQ